MKTAKAVSTSADEPAKSTAILPWAGSSVSYQRTTNLFDLNQLAPVYTALERSLYHATWRSSWDHRRLTHANY